MNYDNITFNDLEQEEKGCFLKKEILPKEVEGVCMEHITIKGPHRFNELLFSDVYDVFLILKGSAIVESTGRHFEVNSEYFARMPYNKPYSISVKEGQELHFLRLRKSLDKADWEVILQDKENHALAYIKALEDCPTYTEDIKSSKTLNRMILNEGMVPRFCMGSVETAGPDEVAEHDHPMLDQIFFGLKGCNCICTADGEKAVLKENTMLHIPLGSKHAVSVKKGDVLAYIWFDFFLTIEGQKYMEEQHKMSDD